jgi:hypothetical protein
MFGIGTLAIVPIRLEASDRSEMVSQLLFGEHFEVLDQNKSWSRIRVAFDGYEGWIDNKQYRTISESEYQLLHELPDVLQSELIDYVSDKNGSLLPIPLGSCLQFLANDELNAEQFVFEGEQISGQLPKEQLIATALLYLHAPYLWGGKTPFGIDCSGFTQMVYRLNGRKLLRDAALQATQGEPLSFIEESSPGDLAFFDNEEGKIIHVGIMMSDNYIIHASGKVRIDRLDHLGIYNADLNRHTHKLRVIKKYF